MGCWVFLRVWVLFWQLICWQICFLLLRLVSRICKGGSKAALIIKAGVWRPSPFRVSPKVQGVQWGLLTLAHWNPGVCQHWKISRVSTQLIVPPVAVLSQAFVLPGRVTGPLYTHCLSFSPPTWILATSAVLTSVSALPHKPTALCLGPTLPSALVRKSPSWEIWGECEVCHFCFPSLKNNSPLKQLIQCLKIIIAYSSPVYNCLWQEGKSNTR